MTLGCVLCLVSMIACSQPTKHDHKLNVDQGVKSRVSEPNRVQGEYLLVFKKGVTIEQIRDLYRELEVIEIKKATSGRYLLKVRNDPGPTAIKQLSFKSKLVKEIQPNYIYRIQ